MRYFTNSRGGTPSEGAELTSQNFVEKGASMIDAANCQQQPVEPSASECCGNDCVRCVWIVYWEEMEAWKASQKQ
jgi:hypothetical protein